MRCCLRKLKSQATRSPRRPPIWSRRFTLRSKALPAFAQSRGVGIELEPGEAACVAGQAGLAPESDSSADRNRGEVLKSGASGAAEVSARPGRRSGLDSQLRPDSGIGDREFLPSVFDRRGDYPRRGSRVGTSGVAAHSFAVRRLDHRGESGAVRNSAHSNSQECLTHVWAYDIGL